MQVQIKEAPHQVDDGGGFGVACRCFQGTDRGVHDFVDDAASQRFDGKFLVGGHGPEAASNPINLGLTNRFQMVLQADDGGNHIESLQACLKFLDLAIDDGLRLLGFFLAIGYVRSHSLLQIVDVINENAVEFVDLRVDVAWNGDIDEEHGLVLAARHQLFTVFAPEDEVRGAGRGNYDVGALAGVIKAAELDCLPIKFLRQPDGTVIGAVGDKKRRGPVCQQMPGS